MTERHDRTSTAKVLTSIYKKAVSEDVRIPCGAKEVANNMRFQAYAFARKMRRKLPEHDELIQALDAVSLTVEGSDLVARGKVKYSGMQAAIEAMGGLEEVDKWAGRSKEDLELEASMQRTMGLISTGGTPEISLNRAEYKSEIEGEPDGLKSPKES